MAILNEGLRNPILLEDTKCFQEWYSFSGSVSGIYMLYPDERKLMPYTIKEYSKEQMDKVNENGIIVIINGCWRVALLVNNRILYKYNYKAGY